MARQRGGGRRGIPPNLRGTLGTLLRTTLSQVGAMRDIAMDQARNQRVRLDTALLQRRVRDTLADLGEVIYEMAVAGELGDLEEVPEIADCLAELEELEQRIVELEDRTRAPAPPARGGANWSRSRRSSGSREQEPKRDVRVWRPSFGGDDGTVSAFDDDADPLDDEPPPEPRRRRGRRSGRRSGGGIAFVDDAPADPEEDLSAYMNDADLADEPDK